MSKKPVIGIDLGGTNMQVGVVTASGRVIGRAKKKTRASEGLKAVVDRLLEGIEEACADAKLNVRDLGAVGIGAPGAIEPKTGMVLQAPNLRWTKVPLPRILKKRIGRPVAVTNDVRAAVVGEHAVGAGAGCTDMMAVWIGTGVGGGLILNNELYTGFLGSAGEIGHMTLIPGNPPAARSFEHICSRTSIADRIVRMIRQGRRSMISDLLDGNLAEVKAKAIGTAYHKGDVLAREVVDDAARFMGIAIASLNSALSLQRVVLGGGLTEALGDSLVRVVRAAHNEAVFPHVCRKTEIVKTKLGPDAGVMGAAIFARRSL